MLRSVLLGVNDSGRRSTSLPIAGSPHDRPSSPPKVNSIHAALGDTNGSNVHIGNNILMRPRHRCRCIETLTLVDPVNDKKRIEKTKGDLLRDCYCWVLKNDRYRCWLNGENPRLWVSGDAGKGKTMLLCGIITELEASIHVARQAVAYFFCEAADNQRNSATAILRGLIGMLVVSSGQDHDAWPEIHRQHKKSRGLYLQDVNAWHLLEQIFDAVLDRFKSKEIILVVDALDECVTERTLFLKLVCRTNSTAVKWILSSRNHAGIDAQLREANAAELNLESRSASVAVAAAVRSYISHKVTNLSSHLAEARKNKLLHFMQSNASGTFLWVSLVFKAHLEGRIIGWSRVKGVVDLPPELDAYYQRMIENIDDRCVEVINVMLFLCRPVSLAELSVILGWQDTEEDPVDWKKIISACGSFLTLQSGWRSEADHACEEDTQTTTVHFVHTSAKDFILRQRSSDEAFARSTHLAIAHRLLDFMSVRLRRNFYRLPNPAYAMSDLVRPHPDPLEPLRYACVYWTEHLFKARAVIDEQGILPAVSRFLRRRSLNWIEALSLMKETSAGLMTLRTLHHLLEVSGMRPLKKNTNIANGRLQVSCPGSEVTILAQDLHRLLWSHRNVLEEHPLQVYSSALLFSALRRTTRIEFSRQKSDWVWTDSVVKYEWEPCLQTIEGHDSCINTVASSADGLLLASGSCDKTVKIWREGSLTRILQHSDVVLSICFSPDGKYIATGSRGKKLKVWHIDTGQLHTAFNHASRVTSVTFSHDSTRVLSGTRKGDIRIISLKEGVEVEFDLDADGDGDQGNKCMVNCACFSADGTRIAWGTEQGNIGIWYLNRGPKPQVFLNHGKPIRSIFLDPDGAFLVSVAQDRSIHTWDIRDIRGSSNKPGSEIVLAHSTGITTASFSSDGTRLVSGSCDKKCIVWCAKTGECLAILGGEGRSIQSHQLTVHAAVFFKNDSCVISGSADTTIKIWDLEQETVSQPPEHGSRVTSIAISQDGTCVVTGSTDKTVKLWAAATAECVRTLQGHSSSVTAVAFSTDGNLVASGSCDSTVHVWELEAGDAPLKTLQGGKGLVSTLVFSACGRYLTFGLDTGGVALWDLTSEEHWLLDGCHDGEVTSVAFSLSGTQLASSSSDGTVKLWAPRTGKMFALQRTLSLGRQIEHVKFNNVGTRLFADSSVIRLESPTESSAGLLPLLSEVEEIYQASGYNISLDKRWVTLDGHNLMSLPFNYRPSCMAAVGNTIFIGCESGQLFTIKFLSDVFPQHV